MFFGQIDCQKQSSLNSAIVEFEIIDFEDKEDYWGNRKLPIYSIGYMFFEEKDLSNDRYLTPVCRIRILGGDKLQTEIESLLINANAMDHSDTALSLFIQDIENIKTSNKKIFYQYFPIVRWRLLQLNRSKLKQDNPFQVQDEIYHNKNLLTWGIFNEDFYDTYYL